MSVKNRLAAVGIFALCFGYFAAYVPYSMMTKMITSGLFDGMGGRGFSGFVILPVTVTANFVLMILFLTMAGWWQYAGRRKVLGLSIPWPRGITFISGLCTSGVIMTTTLAYTFSGVSIVFAMLLMRGGVLAIAPVVDFIAVKRKRKIYWPSWVAALLSLAALLVTFSSGAGTAMTTVAVLDIVLYLLSYFLRLFIMSNWAKSGDLREKKRYFTEEQMVANPALVLGLLVAGLIGSQMDPASFGALLWKGFVEFPFQGFFWTAFWIGAFSCGTGLFGGLIFLDRRENTFTVPANRCASVIAGVISTFLLAIFYGQRPTGRDEWIGVALILGAIFFLAYRSVVEKKLKKQQELFPELVEKPLAQTAVEVN